MKPYNPANYSFEDAAHLYRRMGFGGTPQEIEALRKLGPTAAVENLMRFSDNDGTQNNPHDLEARFKEIVDGGRPPNQAAAGVVPIAQAWWIYKLVNSSQPFKEKLTLFWHGHFATGLDKVRSAFMLQQQNELLRRAGLGKFQQVVLAVAQDPAMLIYLDNNENTKNHPNENFARELMELFTMGVHGGYTEKDVQESARSFTGWSATKQRGLPGSPSKFVFNQKDHDTGTKNFLGQNGNFAGEDIVRMVSTHPSTAKFMTTKLWRFFVNESISDATSSDLVSVWTRSDGDIREVLRTIFTSAEFYAAENRQNLIKSPLEYVVGSLRASQTKLGQAHDLGLIGVVGTMAQIPFYPPNVKGWDGGLDWIADTTILSRLQFIGALTSEKLPTNIPKNSNIPKPSPSTSSWPVGSTLDETLELIGQTYLGAKPTGTLEKALRAFAKNRNSPEVAKGLAYLVMVSPQYHIA